MNLIIILPANVSGFGQNCRNTRDNMPLVARRNGLSRIVWTQFSVDNLQIKVILQFK